MCFVLYRCYLHVQELYESKQQIIFPFASDIIEKWLKLAQIDCENNPSYQQLLGGTECIRNDKRTYWTLSQQFYSWWKNNIERKNKLLSSFDDGKYLGVETKLVKR